MRNSNGWPLRSVVSAASLHALSGPTVGISSEDVMDVWVLRSERDNKLMLSGSRFDPWTNNMDCALQFPNYREAETYRDAWTKEHKPHWPVLVRKHVR